MSTRSEDPFLSLVVPVFNGAAFIEANLRTMVSELRATQRPFELIVVCDGSRDETHMIAEAVDEPEVRVFHYPDNQGKGFAISLGVSKAHGRLVGWLDADLDIQPDVIVRAVHLFQTQDVDAVIGSKRHEQSHVHYPRLRRVYSWGFQMLIRVLFRLNVRDTQVGAKLFRREMLDTVLPLLMIKRYAYDLEVLAVGAVFGFDRVVETPIRLEYQFTGTGIDWRSVRLMFTDTLAIAYRIHLRHHYAREFAKLQRARVATGVLIEPDTPQPPSVAAGVPLIEERA